MKKPEVESILLVDKYLICNVFEKKEHHANLTRKYLTRKVSKALQKKNKNLLSNLLGFLGA